MRVIHKLRMENGIFWDSICNKNFGSNPELATELNSEVTCKRCLKILNDNKNK